MTKKKQSSAQVQMLPMSAVEINAGQLEGLPANPREIRDEKFEKLKANIQKYPELLEYRSLMVYPMPNGKHIIIGGNMRYRAMQELGYTEVPYNELILVETGASTALRASRYMESRKVAKMHQMSSYSTRVTQRK